MADKKIWFITGDLAEAESQPERFFMNVDFGQGLEIFPIGLPPSVTREQIAERLRPLLALPVEVVLATHGGPTDRAGLEHALS